jgi:mannose-6-phosphate isomerase-like protein (cupin superfamily)
MSARDLEEKLGSEGFAHTYVWTDRPSADSGEHTHAVETAHIILEGERILTMRGKSMTDRAEERCDAPAGGVHSAEMDPRGCG